MTRRVRAVVMWLVYVAGLLWLGLESHHHERGVGGFDPNCAACVWSSANAADVFEAQPGLISPESAFCDDWPADVAIPSAEFFAATATRAPPRSIS
ncbi:MAG: hypothetical protein NZ739_09110 [Verrucomicrobiae bacterium]|nr:hypothetical protein [Verrucomicrobiae bacterium]MDW7980526.1 hypothetical protein [Verrucomicrobiales bacterium]